MTLQERIDQTLNELLEHTVNASESEREDDPEFIYGYLRQIAKLKESQEIEKETETEDFEREYDDLRVFQVGTILKFDRWARVLARSKKDARDTFENLEHDPSSEHYEWAMKTGDFEEMGEFVILETPFEETRDNVISLDQNDEIILVDDVDVSKNQEK